MLSDWQGWEYFCGNCGSHALLVALFDSVFARMKRLPVIMFMEGSCWIKEQELLARFPL